VPRKGLFFRAESKKLEKCFKEESKRKAVGMKIAGGREVEKWGRRVGRELQKGRERMKESLKRVVISGPL
jgi:hypothetical protein